MKPKLIVVVEVANNEIIEMSSAKNDKVFQAFNFDGLDPPSNKGVLIRCLRRGYLDTAIVVLKHLVEVLDILVVVVADEILHR